MPLKAPIEHISLDESGRPWISDKNIKVIEIVLDQLAHGWSPEEIHFQHFGGLSMAEIHAALAYYYDNQAAMDEEIEKQLAEGERKQNPTGESPLRRRLRNGGRLA